MTISATTQGLRMGVATSTSRPTVPFDGQVISETDTDSLKVYNGSAWVGTGGLALIKTQTIGSAVSSVTVSDAFNTLYDNYKIIVSGGVASTTAVCAMTLGATATGYYRFMVYGNYGSDTINGEASANSASWSHAVALSTNSLQGEIDLYLPNAAKTTHFIARSSASATNSNFYQIGGFLDNTTSYTAFTITPSAGTLTGGTIRVYGYQNS